MKYSISFVAAIAMAGAMAAQANQVVNGSFEDPNVGSGWGWFESIPGWTPVPGSPWIEIGAGTVYGVTGYDGNAVMELDSFWNVEVQQIVETPGGSYNLSFLYAHRPGTPAGGSPPNGTLELYWNGTLVTSVSPTLNSMSLYSTTLDAVAGPNTLEFRGTGPSDQWGALIDDVKLSPVLSVPDDGVPVSLLALAVGGICWARRKIG